MSPVHIHPIAAMAETDLHQLHVAVIAFPYGSHGSTILNITRGLAAAAPNVSFSIFNTENSNASLFGSSCSYSCSGYGNIYFYTVDDGIPDNHVLSGDLMENVDLFLKATPDNFIKAINKAVIDRKKKITCVINDAFLSVTGSILAENLGGVPWIPVWFSGASAISFHFHADLIRETLNGKDDEILDFIPGMTNFRSCDLPDLGCKDIESPFGRTLYIMGAEMPHATAVIINSFEDLERGVFDDLKSKLKMCLAVGPLYIVCSPPSSLPSLDDPYGCISWLHCQKPASVAYISFGTSATPPSDELFALAEGLEASGVPFLWSLKDNVKAELSEGFLERTSGRGKLVPWTPQTKILEHSAVGVCVTHCGWNSVLDCIVGGVPMICRPFFGDQSFNAQFVSRVGEIGVVMDDKVFTKEGTMKALDLVLCKEQGEKMRGKAAKLREKAKQSVSPTGSSSNNFKKLLEIITTS